jgi:hypothetical protein
MSEKIGEKANGRVVNAWASHVHPGQSNEWTYEPGSSVIFSLEVGINGLEEEASKFGRFKEYYVQVVQGSTSPDSSPALILTRATTGAHSTKSHHIAAAKLPEYTLNLVQFDDHLIEINHNPNVQPTKAAPFKKLYIRPVTACRTTATSTDEKLFGLFAALVEAQGQRSKQLPDSYYVKLEELKTMTIDIVNYIQKNITGKPEEKIKRSIMLRHVEEAIHTEYKHLDGFTEFYGKFMQVFGLMLIKGEAKNSFDALRSVLEVLRAAFMQALATRNALAYEVQTLHLLISDDVNRIEKLLDLVFLSANAMLECEKALVIACSKEQRLLANIRQESPMLAGVMEQLDKNGSSDRRFDDLFVLGVQRLTRRTTCFDTVHSSLRDVAIVPDTQKLSIAQKVEELKMFAAQVNEELHMLERDMTRIASELKPAVYVSEEGRVCLYRALAQLIAPERLGGTITTATVLIFNDCIIVAKSNPEAKIFVGSLNIYQVYDLRTGSKTSSFEDQSTGDDGFFTIKVNDDLVEELRFLKGDSEAVKAAIKEAKLKANELKIKLPQRELRRSASVLNSVRGAVASPSRLLGRASSIGRSPSSSNLVRPATVIQVSASAVRQAQLASTPSSKASLLRTESAPFSQNMPPNSPHFSREASAKLGQTPSQARGNVATPPRRAMGMPIQNTPTTGHNGRQPIG